MEFEEFPYKWKDDVGKKHINTNFKYTWNQIKNLDEVKINRDIPGVETDEPYFKGQTFCLELSTGWIRWYTVSNSSTFYILGMSNFFHKVNLNDIFHFIIKGH